MLKLLFIIHSLEYGGTERQLVELIKGLSRYRYIVHIICLSSQTEGYADILKAEGKKIRYFCRSYKYDFRPVFAIYRYIKLNQISLVHTFENLGSIFGMLAAKLSKRPIVCSAIRSGSDRNFHIKISMRILARFADIFVANSWAGLTNRFSSVRSNFRVVLNGIDFKRFEEKNARILRIKKDIGISGFKYVIGMVASLSDHKDHVTLLNAASMVIKKYPETCFLLIGDGRNRGRLESLVRHLGLSENVIFLGYRDDVDDIIQIFDLAVLQTNSDIILEGISNSVLEAMSVGIPVIASSGGGTDEIVKNNINGILVKPKNPNATAEAIITILEDKDKAKRLADNAKVFVREKFNMNRYVSEYEDIYKDLASRKNSE